MTPFLQSAASTTCRCSKTPARRIDRAAAARKLGRELSKQSKTLARNSLRGRIVPELLQQGITEYREILVSRYRIIYRLHPEAVRIEAVIDASRDFGDVLLRRILR